VARGEWFTSQAGRSCLVPGGPWERERIRPSRSRARPGQKSAGLIVPSASPGKPGEREGALLQSRDSPEVGRSDCPTARNGADKVRNLQRALYRNSKPEKEARFYRVYDKVWRADVLGEAWRQVKANQGAPGIEAKTIEEIVAPGQEEARIEKLQTALRAHRYQFAPVRVGEIPKPKGGTRPLGMATVEDRVVQTAMKRVLGPSFEADFHECSSGYRPKRDAKPAALAIREDRYKHAWGVVEMDFKSYFTRMPHGKLRKRITKRMAEGRMLKLIKQTLKVGIWEQGQVAPTKIGVPQGSPISPLDSHLYLNLLDQLWHRRGYREKLGATLHRYADDALLVCRKSARPALAALAALATRMDLTLKRDKTRETRLTEGVDVLGVQFVNRQSPPRGKHTLSLFPAKSAQPTLRNKLKYLTSRRAPISPQEFGAKVNPRVTGGMNYFRHTNASQAVRGLPRVVNIRFRRYLTQRSKGRGFGWKR
jgi:RNA-directed DNA polymerase